MASTAHPFLRGAFILTFTGFLSRILGFFYRIFLSHRIGAEGMGIYQLAFPVLSLCMALTSSGIQTAISRYVASKSAVHDTNGANAMFISGSVLSFLLSCLAAAVLYTQAEVLSRRFLHELRTAPLLRLLAFSLPMSTIHSCVSGYCYARKEAELPAGLQLFEQAVHFAATWMVCRVMLAKGAVPTPAAAAFGMFFSELVSAAFALLFLSMKLQVQRFSVSDCRFWLSDIKQLLSMALPLTANRVLLTALVSAETILIPLKLQSFGLERSAALSAYGVLTGMALPLIRFPSTITTSAAILLLPSVAGLQALGSFDKIRQKTGSILRFCLALGFFCTVFFFFGSRRLGLFLFHEPMAGEFLRPLSFICPFLYLNTTLSSTLHGLGQTAVTFLHSLLAVSVRLCAVLFLLPQYGMKGYLWGILLGELVLTLLNGRELFRILKR